MAQAENQSKQMEFDAQQGYDEAQMDHQEKMAQSAVRDKEQEARRLESNNQIQLQLLEIQALRSLASHGDAVKQVLSNPAETVASGEDGKSIERAHNG